MKYILIQTKCIIFLELINTILLFYRMKYILIQTKCIIFRTHK